MKLLQSTLLAATLTGFGTGISQAQEPAPTPVPEQATIQLSDADVQKFAEIYVDVETARAEMAEDLSASGEPVDAEDAQVRLQQQLVATIEEHGWSIERYNDVATAISNDPVMRDRAVELITQLVSG